MLSILPLVVNIKLIASLIVFSFVLSTGSAISLQQTQLHYDYDLYSASGSQFYGNITIYGNGTVSPSGNEISHSGNVYQITENINGSLKFLASNSILQGNGYTISGAYTNSTLLTVANNSGSSVENLKIDSFKNSSIGISVNNTARDSISQVSVNSTFSGLDVLQNVQYLNVSNSYFNTSSKNPYVGTLLNGINARNSNLTSIPTALPKTGNLSFFDDHFVSGGMNPVILTLVNHVSFTGSKVVSLNNESSITVFVQGNFTVFRGDSFVLSGTEFGILLGDIFNKSARELMGSVFSDNIVQVNSSLGFVLGSTSPISISGNSFTDTHNLKGAESVIVTEGNNTTISGNSLSVNTTGENLLASGNNVSIVSNIFQGSLKSESALGAIVYQGNNSKIANNTMTGNFSSFAVNVCGKNISITGNEIGFGQLEHGVGIAGGLANSTISGNRISGVDHVMPANISEGISIGGNNNVISHNRVIMNGTEAGAGISVDGSFNGTYNYANDNIITGNEISVTNSTSGIGLQFGFSYYGISNTTVSGNTVDVSGFNPNGIVFEGPNDSINGNSILIDSTGSSTGIGNFNVFSGVSNAAITNNSIESTNSSKGAQFGFYFQYSLSYSVLTGNTFSSVAREGDGLYINSASDNLSVSGNTFKFLKGSSTSGVIGNGLNAFNFNNNTIMNAEYGLYLNGENNLVFIEGNSFYNQSVILHAYNAQNFSIYHNNFINFTDVISINELSNLSFNASYPIGGNYWSNYTGVDRYSGPHQNLPGPDGIGDTPYNIGSGLKDYYPLMKPWTRPMAVFQASGLLPGQSWEVTFNGKTEISTSSRIAFAITNGTYQNYSYSVGTISGYRGGGQSGTFDYTGNSFFQPVVYSHRFNVTFTESGLPSGMSWSFILNGTLINVTSSSYEFSAYNGTSFTYSINNLSTYYSNTSSGSFSLDGHNMIVNVYFLIDAHITGSIYPSGSKLLINGQSYTYSSSSLSIFLPAGTYHIEISHTGYITKYVNITLTSGESVPLNVTLTELRSPLISNNTYYAIGGVLAAVIVVGAVIYFRRR